MAPPQFGLPRLVTPRAVTWCYRCPGDLGGEFGLAPTVRGLCCCEISVSPARNWLAHRRQAAAAVRYRLHPVAVLSSGPLLSSASDLSAHHRVATRPDEVDGQ